MIAAIVDQNLALSFDAVLFSINSAFLVPEYVYAEDSFSFVPCQTELYLHVFWTRQFFAFPKTC